MLFRSKYLIFYTLQLLTLIASMARGVSYGIIFFNFNANPFQLGFAAAAFCFCSILGYFLSSPIIKKLGENKVFIINQIAFVSLNFFSLVYLQFQQFLFIWIILSALPGFFGSLEAISRPNYVINNFNKKFITNIVKNDVMLMGLAKIGGFLLGGFFSIKLIYLIFAINMVICSIFLIWLIRNYKNNHIAIHTKEKFKFEYLDKEIIIYMFFDCIVGFFIYPINTQAITIAKINNINFIYILVFSSIGNLFLNGFIFSKQKNKDSSFYLIGIFLVGLFSLTVLKSNYVLISSFLMGASYSGLLIFSKGNIYKYSSDSPHRNEYLSFCLVMFSFSNILGALFFSYLLSKMQFNTSIYFYGISLIISFAIYKKLKHQINFLPT